MKKSKIIQDLQDLLSDGLSGIKYIGRDWGQLAYDHPPVRWPCVLIDIEHVEPRSLSDLNEHDEAIVVLTVANQRIASGSSTSPQASKEKSVETMDLTDDAQLLVRNYAAPGAEYNALQFLSFDKVYEYPGIEAYAMRYKTRYNVAANNDEP